MKLIDEAEERFQLSIRYTIRKLKSLERSRNQLEKMEKKLDSLIDDGKCGLMETERVIKNIKAIRDQINQEERELPNPEADFKKLIEIIKVKYPEQLENLKISLERNIIHTGVI